MKTLKTLLSVIFFISIFSGKIFSQEKNQFKVDEENIKAEKVAFITERIGLTVNEAQVFWPIFNEHDSKMDKLFEEERNILEAIQQKNSTLSEKEMDEKTDRLINIKLERANLEKEYHEKYKTILSAKKIALFYQSNKEFRKHLMKKYSNCKSN